eukprot:g68682.t1
MQTKINRATRSTREATRRPGVMGAVDELLRHRDMWDPDRPLPSGPKHRITVYADGITHDSDFIPYSSKSTLLAALRQGKTPAEFSGGKCPHSILLYDKSSQTAPK